MSSEVIIFNVLDVFEKGSAILLDVIITSLSFTVSFWAYKALVNNKRIIILIEFFINSNLKSL